MKAIDKKRIEEVMQLSKEAITKINSFKKVRRTIDEDFVLERMKYLLQVVNREMLVLLKSAKKKEADE